MTRIVEVPCHWCGFVDLAYDKTVPWWRFCPMCRRSSWIVSGKVDSAETERRDALPR